jgi:hypothetical protein
LRLRWGAEEVGLRLLHLAYQTQIGQFASIELLHELQIAL